MENEERICGINETVMCYHFDKLYPAKCLNVAPDENGYLLYFIHYRGWSKKWDEWVPVSRLVKYNPDDTTMLTTMPVVDSRPKKSNKSSKSSVPHSHKNLSTLHADQEQISNISQIENFELDQSLRLILHQDRTYVVAVLINMTTVDEVTDEFLFNNSETVHDILLRYLTEISLLVEPNMRKKVLETDPIPGGLPSPNGSFLSQTDDKELVNGKPASKNSSNTTVYGPTTKTLMRMTSVHHPISSSTKSNRKRPIRKIKNFTGFNFEDSSVRVDTAKRVTSSSNLSKTKNTSKNDSIKATSSSEFSVKKYIDYETYQFVRHLLEKFISYFNQYFFQHLLYEEEISLYDILKEKYGDTFLPSGIFGLTYLLRLLYKMKEIIKLSSEDVSSKTLYRYLLIYKDLNVWLDQNMETFLGKSIAACDTIPNS